MLVGPERRESLDLPRPQIHSDEPVRPLSILYGDGGEPIGRHGRLIQPRPLSDATLPSLPVIAFKMCRELGRLAEVTVVSRKQDDHFAIGGADTEFIDIDASRERPAVSRSTKPPSCRPLAATIAHR